MPPSTGAWKSGSTPTFFVARTGLGLELKRGALAMNRELVTGLAQLSAEKGLPKEVVGDIIARALKRAYGAEENIDVKVDISTGAFRVYLLKTVVQKVEDPKLQIELKAAQRIKPDAQLGDIVPLEESAAALGRIGAQTAKQVIQQSLREAEREQVFAEYADREGDIINGQISRFEAGSARSEEHTSELQSQSQLECR